MPKNMPGISFRNGYKFVNGQRVWPLERRTVLSSDGYTRYTVVRWADGQFSCNCPGWVHHGKCRHIKESAVLAAYSARFIPTTPEELAQEWAENTVEATGNLRRRIDLT